MLGNSPNIGTSLNKPVASLIDFKPFAVVAGVGLVPSKSPLLASPPVKFGSPSVKGFLNNLPTGPSLNLSIENVLGPPLAPSAPAKNLAPLPRA